MAKRHGLIVLLALATTTWYGSDDGRAADHAANAVKIGTGSTAGVYYQVGRGICHMLGKYAPGAAGVL